MLKVDNIIQLWRVVSIDWCRIKDKGLSRVNRLVNPQMSNKGQRDKGTKGQRDIGLSCVNRLVNPHMSNK